MSWWLSYLIQSHANQKISSQPQKGKRRFKMEFAKKTMYQHVYHKGALRVNVFMMLHFTAGLNERAF